MKLKLCIVGFFFCLIAAIGLVSINDTQNQYLYQLMVPSPFKGKAIFLMKKCIKRLVTYQKRKSYHLQTGSSKFGAVDLYQV